MHRPSLTAAALLLSTALVAPARAVSPRVFSPAWFAARTAGRAAAAAPGAVAAASGASLAQVTLSIANLQRAAQAIAAANAAQNAARAAALTLPSGVPDGLQAGGLQPAADAATNPANWQGANLPTQTISPARTTVTVQQTARQAVLTWQSFSVGRHTTLNFDQSAGGSAANTWVALNRIADPNQRPSQILGAITAPGQVYVINANGILFGPNSQVNTGALVASTATLNTAGFLQNGLYSANPTTPAFTNAAGSITVEAGAQIATNPPAGANSGGGFVLLLGSKVTNAGAIDTPSGQAAMAAGRDFVLLPGYGSSSNADPYATVQGNQVAVTTAPGPVTNTGLMQAADGDVTLVGHTVTQAGVIATSTGLGQRGTVHLLTATTDPTGSVILAPGSTTAITIDDSSATALEALRSSTPTDLSGATAEVNNFGSLSDIRDLSRIEITAGGGVALGTGSLALATSGQIAVRAVAGTVLMEPGSVADVSGLVGVSLPQSANIFQVSVEPYNLRDSPVNRDTGNLSSTTVSVDGRTLLYLPPGTADSSGRYYTGGGLLEVSGELGNVGHTIAEYSTAGGSVQIEAPTLVTQPASSINLAGGSIQYQAGPVAQTWLLGADGRLYNLNSAADTVVYTGVFNGFTETHPHWGVSETFYNPLIAPPTIEETGYTVGKDAGSLSILAAASTGKNSVVTVLAAGTIEAGTIVGARQTSLDTSGQTGLLVTQGFVPTAGTLDIPGVQSDVVIGATTPDTTGLTLHSRLAKHLLGTIDLPAPMLDAARLGGLTIETGLSLAVSGGLTLADGGNADLSAPAVLVSAPIVARGGTVSLGYTTASPVKPGSVGRGVDAHTIAAAVVIDNGASIDTRGVWTNALLDPQALAGEAYVNGGAVTVTSAAVPQLVGTAGLTGEVGGSITLAAGSTIDASAGGYVSASGKITGGAGGNIALLADGAPGPSRTGALVLDGTVRALGYTQGGTLTLQAPGIAIGDGLQPQYAGELVLPPALFASGFSDYVVTSESNLRIPAGTPLAVVEPVYQATTLTAAVPTGGDPGAAFTQVLPPLFLPNPTTARLAQRAGASLTLDAPGKTTAARGTAEIRVPTDIGNIELGQGATISVDPGRSVVLSASFGATIDGSITAPGGTIEIINPDNRGLQNELLGNAAIRIGPESTLNAAGAAAVALDGFGRQYGTVQAGGTIVLGNVPGSTAGQANATDDFIVVARGATLDASGNSATLDLAAGQGVAPAIADSLIRDDTGGGLISIASYNGMVLDGALRAAAGGPSAAGGTLQVVLESVILPVETPYPPGALAYLVPRNIVLSSAPGADASEVPKTGLARLAVQTVQAGGFGTLSLYASDAVEFAGDVSLALPVAFKLQQGALADTTRGATVNIAAPYVLLAGEPQHLTGIVTFSGGGSTTTPEYEIPATLVRGGTLGVAANLIDIQGTVEIGADDEAEALQSSTSFNNVLPGFAQLDLASAGDIRFLSATPPVGGPFGVVRPAVSADSMLLTAGSVTMRAAQIYPVTGASGGIDAGAFSYTFTNNTGQSDGVLVDRSAATLVFQGIAAASPPLPQSVFGSLVFFAPTIEQGGIVRAPFGSIQIGEVAKLFSGPLGDKITTITPTGVTFLPGSITSASAAGASIPYGGSADGINYDYQGSAVTFVNGSQGPAATGPGSVLQGIGITSRSIDVQSGATLDLQGGGTLTGAAFLPGRGGSSDTLLTPLVTFSNHAVSAPTLSAADGVYALLPGIQYAPPAQPDAGSETGSLPPLGETVAIGAGVPGLPAGTYTLLPSYYALQPGGVRIELRTGTAPPLTGPQPLPNGSTIAAVTTGIANTGVQNAAPVEAIITPAATVLRYSQYDQESYNTFAVSQPSVAVFGNPRPTIPADAGVLDLAFGANPQRGPSFVNDGTELLRAAPGGYDGTLAVYPADTSDSLLVGPARTTAANSVAVPAAALDAVGAATMVVGGQAAVVDVGTATVIALTALNNGVTLAPGASLGAAQLLVTSNGTIALDARSTLDTVGQAASLFDSSSGLRFGPNQGQPRNSFLVLSDGSVALTDLKTTAQTGTGIAVAAGATLYSGGVLAFETPRAITLSPGAHLGAADFEASATAINIGDTADIRAGAAPPGLLLTNTLLDALLAGNTQAGVPGLRTLELTASQSVNFFGSTQLNGAALGNLVLNSPGIYGAGGTDDLAVLDVGTLYWNGIVDTSRTPELALQPPLVGGIGPGTGQGTLAIDAQTIVFGTGPGDVPGSSTSSIPPFARGIFGFGTVDLNASQQIVAGAAGTLLVYRTQGTIQPNGSLTGSGGALVVSTPLLTALPNGTLDVTVGGALTLQPGVGAVPSAARPAGGGGGEIGLSAASIDDATAISLPAGRALLTAQSDLTLEPGARIDVAGSSTPIFDQTVSTPGGTAILSSAGGNIAALPGSSIAFGGAGNQAGGTLQAVAAAGSVALGGTLAGGGVDAADSGAFTLDAQSLPSFAQLNQSLTAGGVFGARSFEIGTGNLTIETADQLQARTIGVSLDGGSLTVDGRVDAAGARVGTIALAGKTGLTLTANAVLAAQGGTLVTDSYGAPIDASNRAEVSLTAAAGTLTLAPGATIALDSADGVARGDLELNAPRTSATGGGIAVAAPGSLAISGAATVALNGFWTYAPKSGVIVQSKKSPLYAAGAVALDTINRDSQAFETAALADPALQQATAGLSAYGRTYHLRPGVIIDSSATRSGDLSVYGDLDLSGFRYGPDATGSGSGEPGVLVLRAAGNLGVYGSITDGFGAPPASPDRSGWVVQKGTLTPFDTTVLTTVTLAAGTTFGNVDAALGYAVALKAGATLNAGEPVPVAVTLDAPLTLTQAWTLAAPLTLAGGTVLAAGQHLPAGYRIAAKTVLAADSVLPDAFTVSAIAAWPKAAPLSLFAGPVTLAGTVVLHAGDVLPGGTSDTIELVAKGGIAPSRPAIGTSDVEGDIYALAPMLPAGTMSWSIDLVAGANPQAASPTAVRAPAALAPGYGVTAPGAGNLVLDDPHYGDPALEKPLINQGAFAFGTVGFSVVRTGTGSLLLAAGGNIEQQSPYGIYTAGTQGSSAAASGAPVLSAEGLSGAPLYQAVVRAQLAAGVTAYQPSDGGDLTVSAQGSLVAVDDDVGVVVNTELVPQAQSDNVTTGWLWERGGTGTPAAWWINFGSYAEADTQGAYAYQGSRGNLQAPPPLTGFVGLGTLGGGNVSVTVGGNAGAASDPTVPAADGLIVAVGATGRVTDVTTQGTVVTGGALQQQGGGDLTLRVGGALLGTTADSTAQFGVPDVLTDIRGALSITAGSIGLLTPIYGGAEGDPRFITSVSNIGTAAITDGITLSLGDSVATVSTRGDLVLQDALDPGRQASNFSFASGLVTAAGTEAAVRFAGFSLWQPTTAIDLLSAGGNVSPNTDQLSYGLAIPVITLPESQDEYPPILSVAAPGGSIVFSGASDATPIYPVELASSPAASLSLLAGGSIVGPAIISMSGAPYGVNDRPNPFKPVSETVIGALGATSTPLASNATNPAIIANGINLAASLYGFEADTPIGPSEAPASAPIRIYAGTGDIVNLAVGQSATADTASGTTYLGALPTRVLAGNDIVNFGTIVDPHAPTLEPSLFVNDYATDISVLEAGRDIIYASADVAGPGLLYVQAGRDVYQAANGTLASLGQQVVNASIPPSDSSGGAAITVLAGVGSAGPDYAAFADLYFNDADQANLSLLLTDPANAGKVQQTYGPELLAWLQKNVGYTGDQAGALAAFLALPAEQQSEFTLPIYFDELRLSGRQFTDPTSRFYKSYSRGKQAVATLFPGNDYQGSLTEFAEPNTFTPPNPLETKGSITEQPASSITTNYGGAITILAPGGGVTLGTNQPGLYGFGGPGEPYGVLTFGQGDIDVYSLGSVLLGTSRIFTTFGGGITIWSAQGDINAGAGTKSAVVAQPVTLAYDPDGDVTLSPQAPSTGAGIATLNEIPGTTPGDVDLVAPQGTIDAGEAGIRSSGNANLAALAIANGTNIQVQGKVTGTPVVATPNIGALNAAAAASGAAQNAAEQAATKQQPTQSADSIITVEVLGFGGS